MRHTRIAFIAASLLTIALGACVPDDDDGGNNGGGNNPPAPVCPGDDEVRYVSEDPDECAVIRFTCNPGEVAYFDSECGCGCELPECPEASDTLTYASYDPNMCMVMRFACPDGWSHWNSDCGCGCQKDADAGQPCGGLMGLQCDEGFFCAYADDAMCGWADQMGTCAVKPDACIAIYQPVCGCDGRTYGNSCTAASYGVSVDYEGECDANPTER